MDKNDAAYLHINCRICTVHFQEYMFQGSLKNQLKKDAVPTLFSVPNPPKTLGAKRRLFRVDTSTQGKLSRFKLCTSMNNVVPRGQGHGRVPRTNKIV